MTTTLALATSAQVARFTEERATGKASGNFHLTTAAGFRLAVAQNDAAQVAAYLLTEMGISATVMATDTGLAIATPSAQSFATMHRALRGSFAVITATTEDGRSAIHVGRL